MNIDLYSALQSINIADDKARAVVDATQEHIAMQISQAVQPLLSKLETIESKFDAKFESLRWFIGAAFAIFGGAVALVGLGIAIYRAMS